MSNISPVQMDSKGVATFEKLDVQEVKVPMTDAEIASASKQGGSSGCCNDQLSFSRPMRKHIEKKKTYFTQQMISPQDILQDDTQEPILTPQAQAYRNSEKIQSSQIQVMR